MRALFALGLVVALLLSAGPAGGTDAPTPPPTGTDVDYQLGGAATAPGHVGIVVRDRHAAPLRGAYDVCYVNGFQTQPDERAFWRRHWPLVLQRDGHPVTDSAWGEWLLDLGTSAKRRSLAQIVGRWTRGCAADGYDAVESDNLDSFSRSHGLISRADARAFARLLVHRTHHAGLAAGQKNWAEWDGTSVGYDFAIAEECGHWHECAAYVASYGARVVAIEYRRRDFRRTCRRWGDQLAVELRDLKLTPGGVHAWC